MYVFSLGCAGQLWVCGGSEGDVLWGCVVAVWWWVSAVGVSNSVAAECLCATPQPATLSCRNQMAALAMKSAGNTAEAMEWLKHSKALDAKVGGGDGAVGSPLPAPPRAHMRSRQ